VCDKAGMEGGYSSSKDQDHALGNDERDVPKPPEYGIRTSQIRILQMNDVADKESEDCKDVNQQKSKTANINTVLVECLGNRTNRLGVGDGNQSRDQYLGNKPTVAT